MIQVSAPCLGFAEQDFVSRALAENRLSQGSDVFRFEEQFAERLGVAHAVAVSNGTAALHLALAALGIGLGDEVLVPALTFVATANAVAYTGAKPVLVDSDPETWCVSIGDLLSKITPRTRAIIPVHVYGVPCDMSALMTIARSHRLYLVEDAAEGLGGSQHSRALGTFGDAGTFSFYGNKIMTTGEGGAVVTNDFFLATRLRFLRGQAHSSEVRYYHPEIGFNYRMTELQAAVGLGQLTHLGAMIDRRKTIFRWYRERLATLTVPTLYNNGVQAPWIYTCLLPESVDRAKLMNRLFDLGIETRPAFVPLSEMPMYNEVRCPVASRLGRSGISLPTHPRLMSQEVDYVCDELMEGIRTCEL